MVKSLRYRNPLLPIPKGETPFFGWVLWHYLEVLIPPASHSVHLICTEGYGVKQPGGAGHLPKVEMQTILDNLHISASLRDSVHENQNRQTESVTRCSPMSTESMPYFLQKMQLKLSLKLDKDHMTHSNGPSSPHSVNPKRYPGRKGCKPSSIPHTNWLRKF